MDFYRPHLEHCSGQNMEITKTKTKEVVKFLVQEQTKLCSYYSEVLSATDTKKINNVLVMENYHAAKDKGQTILYDMYTSISNNKENAAFKFPGSQNR